MNKHLLIYISLFLVLITGFNFSQTTSGLIGYWPFTGNTNDLSGYNNNGVNHNASLTTDRFGNTNSAYYFSGNSYIDCGNKIPQFYEQLTISVWIKTDYNSNATAYIVGKYGWSTPQKGFHVLMTNLAVQFAWRDAINEYNLLYSGSGIYNNSNWHHIVGTVNNSNYSLWIDGIKIKTYTNNHLNVDMSQLYNLYIGGHFNGGLDQHMYFVGAIDDIRLYNRALADSEIQTLYHESGWNPLKYNVTTSSNPAAGGTTSGDGNYDYSSYVTVTATPNTGYRFLNWTENGTILSTNASYSFNITTDRNLIANFTQNPQYIVTTASIPATGGITTGSGVYNYNSNVQVTATTNNGYKFVNWTENGTVVSTNPTYSFTITSNRNLIANFAIITFTVSTSNNPIAGGSTSGSGVYNYNSIVQVTAIPNTNFRFANWTENGAVVSTDAVYSFTITGNRNLVANFYQYLCTVVTNSNPAAGGATSGSGAYDTGTNVLVIATPNPGYSFSKWTEFGIEVSKSQYYSFTINADRNLSANFTTIPTLSVSPLYIDVVSNAGTGNFSVSNTTGGSMNWTAFSNSSWITITSGSSGTNSGTINISYQANLGSYRVGTITVSSNGAIGDPQTVEVRQSPFTSVDMLNSVPTNFMLYQNYPNPFNPTTRIQFGIPNESFASLKVYDVLGTEIISLVNQTLPAGTYSINFDASKLNNGIYFYRLQAGEFSQTKKMILVK